MKVSRLRKLYSLKGTAELLEFISQNPGATQKDFEAIARSEPARSREYH